MSRANPTACYRELGAELRQRRKAAGLNIAMLSERTGWERSRISRIESGQNKIDYTDVILYLGHCGIYGPNTRDLVDLCRDAERNLGHWLSPHGRVFKTSLDSLVYHESTSDRRLAYEPLLVPGLLQTAEYARARIAAGKPGEEYVERSVRIRMERQRILDAPRPVPATFLIHEQALRLQVGSAAIMHEQMLKIVLLAALSNVTVRVLPSSAGGRSIVGGPFSLFGFDEHPSLVYLDQPRSGLFLEDSAYVARYSQLVSDLDDVALDEGESRVLIAELADVYDTRSKQDDGEVRAGAVG